MGQTEVPMSIEFGSTGTQRQDGQSVWQPCEAADMEGKKYNGFKLIGWVIFITATVYLLI
jgi:hypothetical protein